MWKHIKDFKWLQFWQRLCLWESKKRWRYRYEKCRCLHCWVERFVVRSSLYCGKSTYCWKPTKHWMCWTRIYTIWQDMLSRCRNPHDRWYKRYWGRWIRFDGKWTKFEWFYEDMWESYEHHVKKFWEKNTTIDRIDCNWHYCKDNCRWATWEEQARNTSRCCDVEYKWKKYPTRRELCKELWLDENLIHTRLLEWVPLEQAIEIPKVTKRERDEKWRFIKIFI